MIHPKNGGRSNPGGTPIYRTSADLQHPRLLREPCGGGGVAAAWRRRGGRRGHQELFRDEFLGKKTVAGGIPPSSYLLKNGTSAK